MWQEIVKLAVSNGLFAVLFVCLLIYILRDSRNREQKYQQTIAHLSKHLSIIQEIDADVKEIKKVVFGIEQEGECEDEKSESKT